MIRLDVFEEGRNTHYSPTGKYVTYDEHIYDMYLWGKTNLLLGFVLGGAGALMVFALIKVFE